MNTDHDRDRAEAEDPPVRRSARNARQGRRDKPVSVVLLVSLALVVAGMAVAYLFFFA